MKKIFSLAAFLCVSLYMSGSFNYKGIWYEPDGLECTVVGCDEDVHYLSIPDVAFDSTIIYQNGEPYAVSYNFYAPTKIGRSAFSGKRHIIGVSLGNVTWIEDYAFQNTIITDVTSVWVAYVGDYAFADCQLLVTANFPMATYIGTSAFSNCGLLQAFVLPPDLTHLGSYTFDNCRDLDYVTCTCPLLKEIPDYCFHNCEDLREFNFPTAQMERIGRNAFDGCYSLDEISIPDDIKNIGTEAFRGCTQMRKVYLNGAHTTLGENAFADCPSITTLRLTANEYTPKMDRVFNGSQGSLQVIELKDNSTFIREDCFAGFKAIHTVDMRENVTSIGARAFMGCTALKTIPLPNTLVSIGEAAFYNTGLETVTFPASLQTIGGEAFRYCSHMTSMTSKAEMPPVCSAGRVFDGVDKSIPLYVPSGSVSYYQTADQWKDFFTIQAIDETSSVGFVAEDKPSHDKHLHNGQILILRGDKVYTITGQEVK